jgi:hypothetical protein
LGSLRAPSSLRSVCQSARRSWSRNWAFNSVLRAAGADSEKKTQNRSQSRKAIHRITKPPRPSRSGRSFYRPLRLGGPTTAEGPVCLAAIDRLGARSGGRCVCIGLFRTFESFLVSL